MKFLLIAPPKKHVKLFIESPPIGLGYLATTLRKIGHTVDLKDCIIEEWDNKRLIEYIQDTEPDTIGINLFSTALQHVKELLVELRKQHHRPMVLLGGPHCNGSPEHTLKFFPEADFAFRGESEIPLMEFDEYLLGKRKIEYVKGVVYRQQGKILFNETVEYPNLDEFGIPAWDLIDPKKYFKHINVGDKSINVHFSRGCPFTCRFCVKLGVKVRWRSWKSIWEEIEMLHTQYEVERFIIGDEGFTMVPSKVKEFCQQAIFRGCKYRYFNAPGLRLNCVDDLMLQLMIKARFEKSFGVGIESMVPRVRQELMNKSLTQEDIIRGLECFKRNEFKPVGNFILGFPGDTIKEMKESVNMACELFNKGLMAGMNWVPFIPLPGAPVVNEMLKTGELPRNYDFSAMNFSKVIYAPKGVTLKQLDRIRAWAVFKSNFNIHMLKHFLRPGHFLRAFISFYRIYAPNWVLPKHWRRL